MDPSRRVKGNVAAVVFPVIGASLEDQDAVFVEVDYGGLPGGALVEPGGVWHRRSDFRVEPAV